MKQQINDLESLAYLLDFNHDSIEKALHKTAEYVSKHKLMLTGGTAIDMALRAKGTFLYDDNALPDYDIISDQNLIHATELAKLLCEEGFQDINVISAIHVTTVRVRIKNVTILDATYVPSILIKQIPYLDVQTKDFNFRIVHPNYQKIDQRLSLSALMLDTGATLNIFNRLIKDTKRNEMLRTWYQLPNPSNEHVKMKRIKIKLNDIINNDDTFKDLENGFFIDVGDVCLSGYAAYALYYHEFCKQNETMSKILNPNVVITDTHLEFDIP